MGYQIEPCTGEPEQINELAAFLAAFVADGEGPSRDPAGELPETWRSRLGWWWTDNPYCHEESPKGLALRNDEGIVVGFFGYIPHDYLVKGEPVPSLISTTTFVRQSSREAALGLFLRAHRLRESYQLVDGGPNIEAQAMLAKVGYHKAEAGKLHLYPVKSPSLSPRSLLRRAARMGMPRPNGGLKPGHLVTDLTGVVEVPQPQDGKLRKAVDRNCLAWYLNSGSQHKFFAGWCDESGALQCYLIGTLRRERGLTALVILDHGVLGESPDDRQLNELVAYLAGHPEEGKLPAEVDVIAWPVCDPENARGRSPLAMKYDSKLFYRLPSSTNEVERVCVPFEGDKPFL